MSKRQALAVEAVTRQSELIPITADLGLRGRVLRIGWELPADLTEAEWIAAGELLGKVERSVSWWLGDWWAFGEKRYGDRKALVTSVDWDGPDFQTCMNAASVCKSFPETSRRREALSFKHHTEVAALPPEKADELLAWCEETVAETGKPRPTQELRNAVKEIRRSSTMASLRFPPGRYPLLYADPPWRYDFSTSDSREIENQYPTMAIEEICALPVASICADDTILFMWATNPKLTEALQVLDAWGFEYVTNFVWVKDKIGMGYYGRGQHELLMIARRGAVPPPAEADRVSSVVYGERAQHSAKPDIFYELIETLYPTLSKVELFARRARPGWAAWGNQAPATQAAAE